MGRQRCWAITIAIAVVAACSPPRIAELPPPPSALRQYDAVLPRTAPELSPDPFIRGGEWALYELRFRRVAIAELEILAGDRGLIDGQPAWSVRARAEASGLVELAVDGWWEMSATLRAGEGQNADHPAEESWSVSYRGHLDEHERDVPARNGRHNFLSGVAAARGWAPRKGESASLRIRLHASFDIIMAATEEHEPGLFRRPSVRVVGRADHSRYGFPFEVWISRDEDRVPLLVRAQSKWGLVELELLGYTRQRWVKPQRRPDRL